ncbi:MAG: PTS ascorbate transporter subunit IIC [Anaerolineaceae bacterium]|nr:PTS ascorbate transporter subunit IIC [Anaerolineaceae bacterium]MDD4042605.1 PTS ascorbate transporter subunit IIC [Anaerolineaceae bacterium]MDD4577210.1 PTS ascorbate transporter subunit IIC [Anaerolineaceae bacterium]
MQVILDIFNFIGEQILSQYSIILGLVALVGLLLQKKPATTIISGVIKTVVGVIIIGAGAGVLVGGIDPLTKIINHVLGVQGVLPTNEAALPFALEKFGQIGSLVMVGGFILNVILARITRYKFIYLTGHIMLYVSLFVVIVLNATMGLEGWALWAVGTVVMGLYFTLMPALNYPGTKDVTGGERFSVGHTGDFSYWFSYEVGKLFKKGARSAEEFKLPKSLSFFRDTTSSLALTLLPIFLILTFFSWNYIVTEVSGGQNPIMFAIMSSLTFAAGMAIVLAGVRMMLGEIIPAFAGISEKLVPGAVPAFDCPVVFPYAPTALLFGFISMFIGMVIATILQVIFKVPYVILPGIVPAFFAGGTSGIFGNAKGGWKGAIVGPFIMGIVMQVGTSLLIPFTGELYDKGATFGDPFYATVGLAFAKVSDLIGKGGILGWIVLAAVILLTVFVFIMGKNYRHLDEPAAETAK